MFWFFFILTITDRERTLYLSKQSLDESYSYLVSYTNANLITDDPLHTEIVNIMDKMEKIKIKMDHIITNVK